MGDEGTRRHKANSVLTGWPASTGKVRADPSKPANHQITQTGIMNISADELQIEDVPVELLDIHPASDRAETDESALEALGASMRDQQLQECIARPMRGGRYQLIFGSRRLKAARLAKLPTLRCSIQPMSDRDAIVAIGSENLLRRNLNPIERADYITLMTKSIREGGAGLTNREIGEHFGRTESWAKDVKKLSLLPEPWRSRVAKKEMLESSGRYLVPYLKKTPIMRAINASYIKNPDAWWHTRDFRDQVKFVVARFEEMERSSLGITGGPSGRMVQANRTAAMLGQSTESKELREEKEDRQTEGLIKDLEGYTDPDAFVPRKTLSGQSVKALLANYWDSPEELKTIRDAAEKRLAKIASNA